MFEVFRHVSFDDLAGGDRWDVQSTQGKHLLDPSSARKFRVRDLISAPQPGNPTRGYEFEVPALGTPDVHSTGDVWVTVYRGDDVQQGEDVDCQDGMLDAYASGPLDVGNGSDIVLWVVVRHHHEPRDCAEEATFLPYHYEGFHITPRGFEIFGRRHDPPRPG